MRFRVGNNVALIVIFVGIALSQAIAQGARVRVAGHVEDVQTHAPLAGVNVVVMNTSNGTTTDSLGNFSLSLEPGHYELSISCIGYKPKSLSINAVSGRAKSRVFVSLAPSVYTTNEVIVSAERFSSSPAVYRVKAKDLQYVPNLYSDVLRSVTILPGVSSNNELTSTYNVHGQNFNDNLIYLDGFEIYQPYLVQRGIQESMSLINANMVQGFKFYNAAFPVQYGGKMSSVLDVSYEGDESPVLGGEVNANLLNAGITLHDRIGKLNWIAGFRDAYPSTFTGVLQTKGSYIPRYTDFQLFSSYTLPDKVRMELLFITARNRFDLTPSNWTGNFQYGSYSNFLRLYLKFKGNENYQYNTNLIGLKVTAPVDPHSNISTILAYYSDRESYDANLASDVYFISDPYDPEAMTYLESGAQFADNSLTMNRFELETTFDSDYMTHDTKAGITFWSAPMNNILDESTSYSALSGPPEVSLGRENFVFNSISAYADEILHLQPNLTANLGLRGLKYFFTGEFLLSPRASLSFQPNPVSSLNFGWGFYYQPPSFYETRNKTLAQARSLRSQRSIQYVLSYDSQFGRNTSLMAEVFYEGMSNLIPYSFSNQLELTYGDSNNYEGFAYGLDLQYEGKLSEGLNTYIGYDYLNSMDKKVGSDAPYQRTLLDQTSTIRIYLQDAMPKLRNSQAHVRLLFGTGYLYHPMVDAPGTSPTTNPQMVTDYNQVEQYPWYYRVDMGLTYKFVLGKREDLLLTADVFNVFDNRNIEAYSWYFIPQESPQPVPIPNVLSTRYFDVGARVDF